MDKFQIASEQERKKMESLFLKHNITNYHFTPSTSYQQYDGTYTTTKGENIVFEVKVRDVSSKAYKDTIIEESKLDYLLTRNETPYVFIFFNDNTYLYHRLTKKSDYNITEKQANKFTCSHSAKITKRFVEIPIKNVKLC